MEEQKAIDPLNFAWLLAHYRNRAKLSQSDLARECEFDHSYISRLESEHRLPSQKAVRRICIALNLNPQEQIRLLASAGFIVQGATPVSRQILQDIDALLEHPDLDPLMKKVVLDQLNSIGWWLRLGSGLESKVASPDFVKETEDVRS